MLEIKITLDTTSRFESVLYRIAEALAPSAPSADNTAAETAPSAQGDAAAPALVPPPAAAYAAPFVAPIGSFNTAAQATPAPAGVPYGQPQSAPTVPPQPAAPAPVPLAAVPTYTLEQVSKAAADLISTNPATRPELQHLLAQYGVPAMNALKPEQLGPFATSLRSLGAAI